MKFDCVKLSGKLDFIHVVRPLNSGYQTTISVNGVKIPNVTLTNKFYEALEEGEDVTLYGVFKNLKKKEKNDGVIYGIDQKGQKSFATHFRYFGPLMLAFYAALAFCIVFVVGWFANWIPVAYIWGKGDTGGFLYHTTVLAVVEGSLAAAFYLWRAYVLIKVTNDPEAWEVMTPSVLSSRFSKFHK